MENLFIDTLNFSEWAKSIFKDYLKKNLILDPELPINTKVLLNHRQKHWSSLEYPSEQDISSDIRQYRNSCMLSIMTRDYMNLSSFDENLDSISSLAEICIQTCYEHSVLIESKKFGLPIGKENKYSDLIIIGMGKLGGRELNPSSDIDIIFAHTENGKTAGAKYAKKNIENSLFFSKVIKRISDLLSTVTVDGYVFKVDLRLRPHAAMGPTSISINGLKDYFIKDAMTWERFSWTKARVVNSPFIQKSNEFKKHINQLNKLKDEFVFRSYPDFESLESIRNLNKKIKSQHKISGEKNRNGYIFNVKLESGAIRDIEFLVQVQQLVRGGNNHALKSSSTLITLKELSRLEFISSTNEEKIFEAYKFWRTIEHHIQYCFNSQLHTLNVDNIKKITKSLRISSTTKLKQEIVDNQKKIISILNKTLNIHKSNDLLFNQNFSKMPIANFEKKLITNSHSSYDELICSLRKKPSYSRMLDEYPSIQEKIFNITNESLWIADYIKKHPSILDQLLKDTFSTKQIDFKKVKNDLEIQLSITKSSIKNDFENQINILRQVHQANLFKLLVQDHGNKWSIQELSEQMSNLADVIIDTTLFCVWKSYFPSDKFPKIAVIAFGKLGSKEFGFASDLDLIFLTKTIQDHNYSTYIKIIKRFISWLSVSTSAGSLFSIDLRLRPNGNSGLLVTSLESFHEYQKNKAWLWEHQAVSRSRFCAGNREIGETFEEIRSSILQIRRSPQKLTEEIISMRNKITSSYETKPKLFDIKYDNGGMIDIEFITQATVLRYATYHESFCQNIGTINLLNDFASKKVLPESLTIKVANIYAEYRTIQHKYRLKGEKNVKVDFENFKIQRNYVNQLWKKVFKNAPVNIRNLSDLNSEK